MEPAKSDCPEGLPASVTDAAMVVQLERGEAESFEDSMLRGLAADPPTLEPKWLYDARGSELYEKITETEAYYPTRTEDRLLQRYASRLRETVGPAAVVELGSGSSTKTRRVLDAWGRSEDLHYVAIDISPSALSSARQALAVRYPGAQLQALAGTYPRGLQCVSELSPKMVMFLGSTLGNFTRAETLQFLRTLKSGLLPGDHLLLGLDLVKPEAVLKRAYDDEQGWTRAFILNLFHRANRELQGNIDVSAMRYEARWNSALDQVEMWVHPGRVQQVSLAGRTLTLDRPILVEISRKFRKVGLDALLAEAGMHRVSRFEDERGWFSLELLTAA